MLTPYFRDDGITIYHGDASVILPALLANGTLNTALCSVNLMLTDPPYGISGGSGTENLERAKGEYDFEGGWSDDRDYVKSVVVPIIRDYGKGTIGRAIVTPGKKAMMDYPEPDDVGCLWSPAATGRDNWGFVTFNPVLYYGRDPRLGKKGTTPSGTTMNESIQVPGFPCPKPPEVWKWLLTKGSVEGETVIDPFMGSGTTLLVAKETGRRAIGIEISKAYCDIAITRLEKA